jgi:hypothetical protein
MQAFEFRTYQIVPTVLHRLSGAEKPYERQGGLLGRNSSAYHNWGLVVFRHHSSETGNTSRADPNSLPPLPLFLSALVCAGFNKAVALKTDKGLRGTFKYETAEGEGKGNGVWL